MDAAFTQDAISKGLTVEQVNAQILNVKYESTQGGHFGPDVGIIAQIAVHQLADAGNRRFVAAKARGYVKQLNLFFAISQASHLHVILSSRLCILYGARHGKKSRRFNRSIKSGA
jgi:hypothetical protein